MTVKEKLLEELGCAIVAVFGDKADEEYNDDSIDREDLIAVAKKVAFYLDK